MKTTTSCNSRPTLLTSLILAGVLVLGSQNSFGSITLFSDSFESYPAQNPAPNPLTNGPAGGQWFFVPSLSSQIATNEHQILNVGWLGSGLYSRVWASLTNYARLTNAITVSALPAAAPPYTFRLSFVTAADTLTATRFAVFDYAIYSSASDLTFISGRTLDDSQIFSGLSGTGIAAAGTTGKSNNRRFEFVFQSSTITTADTITFDFTRVTNNAGASLNLLLDDVKLTVDDANGPLVESLQPKLTLQNVRINFSEAVDPASATTPANYVFQGGAAPAVLSATLVAPSVVELFTEEQAPNSNYTLQISGVLGESGSSMTSTQLSYTTPALTISPIRYDAGTTVTQPSGPLDPSQFEAGNWVKNLPSTAGFSMAPVIDDIGTGLNAWSITDSTTASGAPNCSLPVPNAASVNLGASNGWRLVTISRLVDNFGTTASDQFVLYYNPGVRFGMSWGSDLNGYLWLGPVGGSTFVVSPDLFGYHTNVMVYDPATRSAAVYFDGVCVVENYGGQSLNGSGLTFGGASTAGKGQMNYNLVQLDVVGATSPTVLLNPASSTNGVGQKVTFTAVFGPYVNAYQWYSNDVAIAGATSTNYTTGFIDSGYNGTQYRLRAFSALGNVDSAPAVLTVTDDTTPPFVVSSAPSSLQDRIILVFSEPVIETYATNIANYSWGSSGVTNISARMLDPLTVELRAGPFAVGTAYTVNISNVRDTSNLPIAQNSPVSLSFPTLTSLGRYDAGTTTSAPLGPPDPTTPEGGNWLLPEFTDPGLSTNAIQDDFGTGLNAWQVRDASTTVGAFVNYIINLSTNQQDLARLSGFVLTVRSRIAENLENGPALFAFFGNYQLERVGFSFNADLNNNLVLGVAVTNGFSNFILTGDGSAMNDYHVYQGVYDPVTGLVSYYYDGNWVVSLPLSTTAKSVPELVWGSFSSAGQGTVNFNLVDFSAVDAPLVSLSRNGDNFDISYRGILETTTQLGVGAVWTAVQTNSTSSTTIYTVPGNSQSQQFFRARLVR